jgi:nucleoside-diphosphate-sugar epimerase
LAKVVFTTGITGFIGHHLLVRLLKEYDYVINFGRNSSINLIQSSNPDLSKQIELKDLIKSEYKAETLIHLATNYNPAPKNKLEEEELINSNYKFPQKVCRELTKIGLSKIVSISSYMQLLEPQYQNFYSQTKNNFVNWAQDRFLLTEIFLFDTFGENDKRDKVVDVFIKNAILNKNFNIPIESIYINLTHVDEIVEIIHKSINIPIGRYMIKSRNQITIEQLAKKIIKINDSKSTINKSLDVTNFLNYIQYYPTNIYKKTLQLDLDQLITRRNNEIKQTYSF